MQAQRIKHKSLVSITAVGDICLSDHFLCYGFGVGSTIVNNGYEFIFKHVKSYLRDADLVFGNLECVLNDKYDNKFSELKLFNAKPETVNCLKEAGFDVLNIANNHTMQHGYDAFIKTKELLKNNNIDVVGARGKKGFYSAPIIKEIKGKSVGLVGYSCINERHSLSEPGYAYGFKDKILDDINKLRARVDLLIVSMHWGLELISEPSYPIKMLAHSIIDAGADLILGHHPHVLQGEEVYKNKLVLYSLGNFVFDLLWNEKTRLSAIYKIYFDEQNSVNYEILPIFINDQYQPIFLKQTGLLPKQIMNEIDAVIDEDEVNLRYYSRLPEIEKDLAWKKVLHVIKNYKRLDKRVFVLLTKKIMKIIRGARG